ncbi:hypothetical protein GCM10023079_25520 [Streptomyces chitinivorans]
MKAVLSGETATAADPSGHPEPLTVTTSITILSVGASSKDGFGATMLEESDEANNAAIAPPTASAPDMVLQSSVCGARRERKTRRVCRMELTDSRYRVTGAHRGQNALECAYGAEGETGNGFPRGSGAQAAPSGPQAPWRRPCGGSPGSPGAPPAGPSGAGGRTWSASGRPHRCAGMRDARSGVVVSRRGAPSRLRTGRARLRVDRGGQLSHFFQAIR